MAHLQGGEPYQAGGLTWFRDNSFQDNTLAVLLLEAGFFQNEKCRA